ncbi:hypothetical protein MPL3356_60493 [Mesorhizobium plurifarium]|uniref:Uncharacterized protein n=1 Tax=Mesorhizobium plurifarium TaxID=69974 RepID=A0A090G6P3_MESPL|nr:hypothetical protein MPL3356_60493 [Mesorhizobium plurifarium]
MKVIKLTGLVPVKALVRHKNIPSGKVFGITPELARKGLAAKEIELYPVPDGIETYDVADFTPAAAPVEEAVVEPAGDVVIPDDWETMQWLKRVKLAQQIVGGELTLLAEEKPLDAAMRVISAEVQRRAAAEKQAE